MDPDNFVDLRAVLLLLISFCTAWNFLVVSVLSAESKYESCRPKTCGSGPNISYPFYLLDNGTDFCGHRGFGIRCGNEKPIYSTSSGHFLIKDIFYGNQSFRLANIDYVLGSTCPAKNYSLDRSSVDFIPYHADVYFFHNCDGSFSANYTTAEAPQCGSNSTHKSYAALVPRDESVEWIKTACDFAVAAPVQLNASEIDKTILDIDYKKQLADGFSLKWIGFGQGCAACINSGGRCGLHEGATVCYCPDGIHSSHCNDGKKNLGLPIGLGIGNGVLLMIIVIYVFWRYRKRKRASSKLASANSSSDPSLEDDLERGSVFFGVPVFSYRELEVATSNFSSENEIGDGGFGAVYYGKLGDGREVAVKRMYEHNYRRVEQFMNEIMILTRMRHKNLVSLYGCTSHRSKELLLVYEYIPNGTVADHLHGDRAKDRPLTWPIRMSIAIETASALAYLHASEIIHRDVKTNNILLDDNCSVKVADFGLSRLFPSDRTHVSTVPQGTPGYVDPEYHQCYQLTDKSDVYSFGVVLIELISSMPAVDISRDRSDINLANLAVRKIKECAVVELIDPWLDHKKNTEIKCLATSVAELAFRCLQLEKDMRPTMVEVVEELTKIQSCEEGHDDKNEDEKKLPTPTSPDQEHDDGSLLKNIRHLPSPIAVTDKWVSSSSTTTTDTNG